MKRNAVSKLIEWKENGTSVPFLLVGTKGTGKTFLAMEFANAYYPQYLYVNFELNLAANGYFEERISLGDTLAEIIASYFQIDELYLSELVVILDEISYCPVLWQELQHKSTVSIIAISGVLATSSDITNLHVCRLYPLGFDEFLFV